MVSPQLLFPRHMWIQPIPALFFLVGGEETTIKHETFDFQRGWLKPSKKTKRYKQFTVKFQASLKKRDPCTPTLFAFSPTKRSRSELTNQQHHKRFISGANGTPICQDCWEVRTCQRWVVPTVGFRVLFFHTNLPTLPAASLRLTKSRESSGASLP